MNTEQIEKILKGDAYAKQIFKRVYPRDKIPTVVKYPSAYVFNSDPSSKPGEHWIALYFDKKRRGEYFDSYGVGPQMHNLKKFYGKKFINLDMQYSFDTRTVFNYMRSLLRLLLVV